MTIGDFLNNLASKIGVQNDPAFVDLLSSSELAQAEINDELAGRFNTGLMSLEGAKNSREVLNHFKPIILKAADDKFAILAAKYGLDNEFAGEQNTYKKIDLLESRLATKIADAEERAKMAGGSQTEEVSKLNSQIAELQKQLQALNESKDREIAEYRAKSEKQQLDFLVNLELNSKHYANADLGETNIEIARALIGKELASQKAIVVNENGVLKLKQADNQSLDFIDSSYKPVAYSDFVNKVLADKHLLEVSGDDDEDNNPGSRAPFAHSTQKFPNEGNVDTSKVDAAAAASLADLE